MKFLRFKTLTILTLLLGAIPVLAQNETKKNDLVEAIKNQNASKPLINATISPNGEINFIPSGTGYIFVPPQLDNIKFSLPDGGPTPGSYSHQLLFNQWTDIDDSDETIFNNENEEDVTAFDPGSLACAEVSEDSLSKAAQDLNWASCYEGRLSWSRSKASEKDLLKSDQNVCGCLKGFTKVPGVSEIMSKNISIKRSKNVAQAELNDILNGVLFQTYALTGDTKLTTKYSNNLYGNKNGQEPTGEKLIYDANTQLVNDKVPFAPEQCLSPRVFLLTKQLPNSNIKMDLQKPFSEENWNYKLLEKRYLELMSLSVAEREEKAMNEIIHLKEKLKFLNRNPVIKYSFAVDISKAEKPEEAKKLKAYVFNQLQTLIPDACADINSKCYHDYKNKMAELVKEPRLIPALRKEARLDHAERLKRKINSSVSEVRKEPTQRGIISEFMEQYRLPSPDTCEKDTTKGIECLEIYSGYCRTLDKYADDIDSLVNTQKISLVYNDLDELMKDDFNPDINTNEDFRMLNDTFCNKPVKRKFTARGYPETATFSQFVNIYCKQKSIPGCARNTNEDYSILREAWGEKYVTDKAISQVKSSLTQEEKHRVESIFNGKVNQMSMSDIQDMKVQTNRNQSDADLASEIPAITKSNIFDRPLSQVLASAHDGADSKSHLASLGQTVANNVAAFNESSPVFDELPVGYANNFSAPMQRAVTSSEIPKVEEMSDEKRRELLSDWQKEYGDWQKEKGDSLSQADKSKDNELRQEIATLKALLDQQKQISEQQYKLLNDAIIAKKEAISQIASAPQEEKISERKSTQSFAAAARAVQEDSGEASRAPASIKEVKHNTSGAMSGAATSTSVSKRNSSSSDGSSDSVAREEAKLVNMRRYSDGSITIEASGKSGNFQGNAITLPVSDEQYRLLQANPSSLNLSQIERNIPKDQIAKLEKSGEIIIFLQNGTNPPFEVKVARKDNRLVYSLKDKEGRDQAPVRRVFTREALAHELKARN